MNRRVAVRALVLDGNKILCVRQKPYNDFASVGNTWWCLPGGKLEAGESLVDAIKREMIEETGIPSTVGNLLYVQQFTHEGQESLEFFFHVTNYQDYQTINLSETSHGDLEIAEIKFVDPRSVTILPAFLSTENLSQHANSNSPAKVFSTL